MDEREICTADHKNSDAMITDISKHYENLIVNEMEGIEETVNEIEDNFARKLDEITSKLKNSDEKCQMLKVEIARLELEEAELQGSNDGNLRQVDVQLKIVKRKAEIERELHIQIAILRTLQLESNENERVCREVEEQLEKIKETY